jgi:thiopeptide-type bacteriocin biosynthesis protein
VNPPWSQVSIHFDPWDTAEQIAVSHLAPVLADIEQAGLITTWFFIRKWPRWRVRFRPTPNPAENNAVERLHHHLDALADSGHIAAWTSTIYEPETFAFGGPTGMTVAHDLFHEDSQNILAYLATAETSDKRRELSILLCSHLLRSAIQDWYEQGDIWARVAEHRTPPPNTPPDRLHDLQQQLQRLMTIEPSTLDPATMPPTFAAWTTAFGHAGTTLADLARTGNLTRGLRAVLAHHILFAWNRLGLSHTTQSLLAHAARSAVFDQ